jgi:formate hydrogenlyase transcriptional activator
LSEQLRRENEYLAEEVKANRNLKLVVGESPAFRRVLDLARAVAPTATTVLLLGETGTGKEVLAETIHNLSPRNRKPFIRVNCAALPSGLIESELFGHERGAFTGADQRRAGRFELADGGTLFLDEIGEMPMDTQAKLLRVLQDGLVDRVGGTKPLPVDVRVIAATNSDLPAAIQAGTFRQDLFYRLHIFPIALPALRDRREDIPRLSQYFLEQIGDKLKRNHLAFDAQSLSRLMDYHWPGNVRELQNVIERAVILSQSSRIRVDEILLPAKMSAPPPNATLELAHLQRDHIIKVLDQTSWRIYGAHGAAQLLGLNPETLRSRLRKLGIRRPAQSRP